MTFAQEIKTLSRTDNKPLPYATVTNHTHPMVVSSNQDGMAKIAAVTGDTLSVSYVGFKTAFIRYDGNSDQSVWLIREQKLLTGITIQSCRKMKEFNYKNSDGVNWRTGRNGVKNYFIGVIWSQYGTNTVKVAVRLSPSKGKASLKDFSFWIAKGEQAPKSSIHAPWLISFYEVSDSTSLPGELLILTPLFYFPKKAGKQTIHLDTLHVRVPPNGIYVSLQYVMIEQYQWKQVTRWRGREDSVARDTTILRYGGVLQGIYSKDFDIVYYNGITNTWIPISKQTGSDGDLHNSIKCEAMIKYCDDD